MNSQIFTIIIIVLSIIFSSLTFITQESWQSSELLFHGKSSFKIPSVIYQEEKTKFSINLLYEKGPYTLTELKPIIDVYPESAASHVSIETESVDIFLHPIFSITIHGVMTVDSSVPADKIFLTAYFTAKDVLGTTYKSSWNDSSNPIEIGSTRTAEWKTIPTVGKYHYNEPHKPAQIFNVQYRVVGGTLDSITANDGSYSIKASTVKENGLFEFKIPLNFPYTNFHNVTDGQVYVVMINQEDVGNIFGPSRLDECYFGFSIPFSGNVSINLAPAVIPEHFAYHGEKVPSHCIKETIFSIPPLTQFRSGITAEDVTCKEGYGLVRKSNNGNPACVKPETAAKLFERGWATSANMGSESSRHCYLDPDPGICKAAIEKYYFDWGTKSCKSFIWGGCGGTVPFDTLDMCQYLCS